MLGCWPWLNWLGVVCRCGCTYTGSRAQVTLSDTGTCAVTQPTDTADVPCPVVQLSGASVALSSALALAALVAMWM